jgi:hypothetical protein
MTMLDSSALLLSVIATAASTNRCSQVQGEKLRAVALRARVGAGGYRWAIGVMRLSGASTGAPPNRSTVEVAVGRRVDPGVEA